MAKLLFFVIKYVIIFCVCSLVFCWIEVIRQKKTKKWLEEAKKEFSKSWPYVLTIVLVIWLSDSF
jgi:ABC-type uncharacterized transport system permease subunit